jgi:hypothetical protein
MKHHWLLTLALACALGACVKEPGSTADGTKAAADSAAGPAGDPKNIVDKTSDELDAAIEQAEGERTEP